MFEQSLLREPRRAISASELPLQWARGIKTHFIFGASVVEVDDKMENGGEVLPINFYRCGKSVGSTFRPKSVGTSGPERIGNATPCSIQVASSPISGS